MGRRGKKTITIPEDLYYELIRHRNDGENTVALLKRLLKISNKFHEIYNVYRDDISHKVRYACDKANILLHHGYDHKKRLDILNKIISVLEESNVSLSETEKILLRYIFEDYNEYIKFLARVNNMNLLLSVFSNQISLP